jgi:hypothetical protein
VGISANCELHGLEISFSSEASISALRPTQPPSQWVTRVFSRWVYPEKAPRGINFNHLHLLAKLRITATVSLSPCTWGVQVVRSPNFFSREWK